METKPIEEVMERIRELESIIMIFNKTSDIRKEAIKELRGLKLVTVVERHNHINRRNK